MAIHNIKQPMNAQPPTQTAPLPPILGWMPSTLLDFEGRIAAVAVLGGCNFRCRVCHAGRLVIDPSSLAEMPIGEVRRVIGDPERWIDAVVVSGGEPTLHPGLPRLLGELKQAGLEVKLDTNGSKPGVLRRLIEQELVDYIALDVKAPLDERYSATAGVTVNLEAIRESIALLISGAVAGELRTTAAPGLIGRSEVRHIAEHGIAGAPLYILQKHRPGECLDPALNAVEPYSDSEMNALAREAAPFVKVCRIRGAAEAAGE